MSAVAVKTRLYCDGMPGGYVPGGNCGQHVDVDGGSMLARQTARERGWIHHPGLNGVTDLCPSCQRPKDGTATLSRDGSGA